MLRAKCLALGGEGSPTTVTTADAEAITTSYYDWPEGYYGRRGGPVASMILVCLAADTNYRKLSFQASRLLSPPYGVS